MSNQRYPEEFKIQAVKQVTEKQLPVSEVAARLGVSVHSLYVSVQPSHLPNSSIKGDGVRVFLSGRDRP